MSESDRLSVSHTQLLEWLQSMDDFEFEHFVADLWAELGYETEVEQQSGDAGVDVRATRDGPLSEKVLIQAKRYSTNTTVGGPEVQQYAALRQQEENVDRVIIVTTSKFTDPAKRRAAELNVKTINGKDLIELIKEYNAHDVVERYIHIPEKPGEEKAEEAEALPSDPTDPRVYGGYDGADRDFFESVGPDANLDYDEDQVEEWRSNAKGKSKRSLPFQKDWDIRDLTGGLVFLLSFFIASEILMASPEATIGSPDSGTFTNLLVITYFLAGVGYPAIQAYDGEIRSVLTFGAFIAVFVVTGLTSNQIAVSTIYVLYGLMPVLSGIYSYR